MYYLAGSDGDRLCPRFVSAGFVSAGRSDVLKLLAAASAKTFASISSNSVGNDGAVALAGAFTEQRILLTLR
jgi:hypothetical protein